MGIAPLRAESPRAMNNHGVKAYQEKKYEQAIRSFRKAQEKSPDNLLLKYNQGAAESAAKNDEDALKALNEAARARNPEVARRAQYGLGILNYQQARKKMDSKQLQEALENAKASVAANQAAILADSKDSDARVNYELASALQAKIETLIQQEQKQKQQNQQQQNQQQPNQDQQNNPEPTPSQDQQDQEQQGGQQQSTPTPAPTMDQSQNGDQAMTPTPSPAQSSEDGNRQQSQSMQPSATPTPTQGNSEANPDQQPSSQPTPSQQADAKKIKDNEEQEALESILNVLDDNDAAAIKQMRKQRYGTIVQPEKDW